MKLTENFTLQEMIHSNTAIAKGIVNMPNEQQINFIRELCINVLQPIREEFGVPIRISSGFRSPRLNVAIGGSTSSQHCALRGAAADIQMDEMNAEIFNYIKDELIFDNLFGSLVMGKTQIGFTCHFTREIIVNKFLKQ